MFYEKLNFTVDIERLREEVKQSVFTLGEHIVQGKEYETPQYHGFGGWSILSRSADWQDGWESFQLEDGTTLEKFIPDRELLLKALKYFGIAHSLEHDKPTQAYVGEIKKVIDQIEELGFYPRRARISCLKAGSKSLVHRDADASEYMARIHIPLWSNEKCVHISDGEHLHMPADGSVYMVWVNIWHQIRNDSDEDRYHLIIDAYDTKRITKYFKYNGNFEQLQTFAREFREKIESVTVTQEDVEFFEAVKQRYITKKVDKAA
jgi:Aspartyl/Asparaginyl beta-hydroxylase